MAAFTRIQELKAWMDTQSDANLITLGYVQAEVNTLRSAITDLNTLASIFTGTVAQGVTPSDYRTFSKLLYGMGAISADATWREEASLWPFPSSLPPVPPMLPPRPLWSTSQPA